ncbi:RHS repeat-associated core domain-containing protein [Alkalitalea saponilacus]|uniref:RHS repeat-associated core domain-containing protein n=1 Tax=Alkalitalea saponilacus TaxID=889453 RepID=A0A1T5BVW6_9BACT|nr:RHS repeat-associated core domain-containing protein [Alkalitalea saponilacus]ASB49577.1 hypothetical protein CDL62_10710 [Alkalitalea saponilacus]SKB51264.1 RHS repeat-associated core domain-containing protein [Alkalitalea saponilacus]
MKLKFTGILFLFATIFQLSSASGWDLLSSQDARFVHLTTIGSVWLAVEYHGTGGGTILLSSRDQGNTWDPVPGMTDVGVLCEHDGKIVLTGRYNNTFALYESTDTATTWKRLLYPAINPPRDFLMNDTAMFAYTHKSGSTLSPVYRSLDGGNTWEPLPFDLGDRPHYIGFMFPKAFVEHEGDIGVFVGNVGFYRSQDGGNTWVQQNDGLPINPDNSEVDEIPDHAPLHSLPFGMFMSYKNELYKYNEGEWIQQDFVSYYYASANPPFQEDGWREEGEGNFRPVIHAYRAPYLFATNGGTTGGTLGNIYYSLNEGEKWFRFSDSDFTSVFGSSILIDGNYVHAGFVNGFAKRSLSEAINHKIKKEEEEVFEPMSPAEINQLLAHLCPEGMRDLLNRFGMDSRELTGSEIKKFLRDQLKGVSSDLFINSQPSACNDRGMPGWYVNPGDLRLFVRDAIFRKGGPGPTTAIAINYLPDDRMNGIFGKHWRFEYEISLEEFEQQVVVTTGSGGRYFFNSDEPIHKGTDPFLIPCSNNEPVTLHWTGTAWKLEKGIAHQFINFVEGDNGSYVAQSIEDDLGNSLTIGYDENFRIVTITDAVGRIFQIDYQNDLCSSILSPDGRMALFEYEDNKLISAIDFNLLESAYEYDQHGNITQIDVGGRATQFSYSYSTNEKGQIESVTDPENREIRYFSTRIDEEALLTNVISPDGKTTSYIIDNYHRLVSVVDDTGNEKKVTYNENGQIESLIWADGSRVAFEYDPHGNVARKSDRNGVVTNYQYNENRHLTSVLDEKNEGIVYNYNNQNRVSAISIFKNGNKDLTYLRYEYNQHGQITSMKEYHGWTHQLRYDGFGNLIEYTNPLNDVMSITYDDYGLSPTTKTDFNGNTYAMEYDGNGRLISMTMPDGSQKEILYDCCAQTGYTDENGQVFSVFRDQTNRIVQTISPEGNTSHIHYNNNGLISEYSNNYGSKKRLQYTDRNFLENILDEEGIIRFSYNRDGNLVSVIDKKGNRTRFDYNNNGQLKSITDAKGHASSFSWSQEGLLNSFTNARGQVIEYTYDHWLRVGTKALNGKMHVGYDYYLNGNISAYIDLLGEDNWDETVWERNSLGMVKNIFYSTPDNLNVGFDHDANGNVISTDYLQELTVANTPDPLNRIAKIEWNGHQVTFIYDNNGNLLKEERSNGTFTEYSYNNDNRLISIEHSNTEGLFCSESVTLEQNIVVSVDALLIPEITGQPENMYSLSSNELNQLEGNMFNQMEFVYDEDGNLVEFVHQDISKFTAEYSHDNRITRFITPGKVIDLIYDGMNYPRQITTNGVKSYLLYDHKGRLLFETDANGQVETMYIYRGKRLIAKMNSEGNVYFYHYNRHGNTLAITDENGSIVNSYAYSAHGYVIGEEESVPNRFKFLGAFGAIHLDEHHTLTGARVYNNQQGRFIQRDPLGILTGTNPYLYASNNPIAGIDPLGFDTQEATINTTAFDLPSDNDFGGVAGGTANPYAENLPYRINGWDIAFETGSNTLRGISDHPISDFLPPGVGEAVGSYKAIENISDGEYGKALWQFVPFNNSLEWIGNQIKNNVKPVNPFGTSRLGVFPQLPNMTPYSCDL